MTLLAAQPEKERLFVLGAGAQKAGTTWLYRYLRRAANADMGFRKEYHVWDRLALPGLERHQAAPQLSARQRLRGRAMARGLWPLDPEALRAAFLADSDTYFTYFSRLAPRPGRLTGDLTPFYGVLPRDWLARIRDGFAERGVQVRAVFFMRDPVERCWSAARMDRERGRLALPGAADDDAALDLALADPETLLRSDYAATLERLHAVFGPDRVHVGLFEEMFQPGEIDRLSAFLGVPARHEAAARPVRAAQPGGAPSPRARAAAAEVFRDTYAFCAARFPRTQRLWRNMPEDLRTKGGAGPA